MNSTPFFAALSLATALVVAWPRSANAYKLYSSKYRIHEQMTERSAECLLEHAKTGVSIQGCSKLALGFGLEHALNEQPVDGLQLEGLPITFGELKVAVRWPDDPQRKLLTLTGMANLGLAFEATKYCHSYFGVGVQYAGLLCASHFGAMQFLHAMASGSNERASETETKILDWTRFAYDYASGQLSDGANLCAILKNYPAIRDALIGADDSYICTGNDSYGPRTVGQLFGFKCKNFVTSAVCWVIPSIRERKLAALGAILHVIQDSYSQAHAQRGMCTAGAAVIRQQAVVRFLNYAEQDSIKHAHADAWPIVDVVDGATEHPVVAGAQVLAFFAEGTNNTAQVVAYLKDHVLGMSPMSQELAAPGDCYTRTQTFVQYEHPAVRAYRNRQMGALE